MNDIVDDLSDWIRKFPWDPPTPPKDPLVIDLGGDGIELVSLANSQAYFDFDEDGLAEKTGWAAPDDGFLFRDKNGDGVASGIGELFGNLEDDGFTELAKLDSNGDGVIDANDPAFTGLRIWRDLNGDGVVARMVQLVKQAPRPRHALLRFKNIGALGRYDGQRERRNYTMAEMVNQVADVIGRPAAKLDGHRAIKGIDGPNTRLFPIEPDARPGHGAWIKITNWQRDAAGRVDPGSPRRGRITAEFHIAPFFETVQ